MTTILKIDMQIVGDISDKVYNRRGGFWQGIGSHGMAGCRFGIKYNIAGGVWQSIIL